MEFTVVDPTPINKDENQLSEELKKANKLIDDTRTIIKQLEKENKQLKKVISEFKANSGIVSRVKSYLSKYQLQSPIKRRA